MEYRFFKLPFKFDTTSEIDIVNSQSCNELESIDSNIDLILTTCPGEHKFDKQFGCGIWNLDFSLVFSRQKWEEIFTSHVLHAVQTYEKRLEYVKVFLHFSEISKENLVTKSAAIKERVEIYISGKLVSGGEPCRFKFVLLLGPICSE